MGSPSLLPAILTFPNPPLPQIHGHLLKTNLLHSPNSPLVHLLRRLPPHQSLHLYSQMRFASIPINPFSFPPLLRAAANSGTDGKTGAELHGFALKSGLLHSDPFIQTALVSLYSALDRVADARRVFDRMPVKDVVAWNVMMGGYCRAGRYGDALRLFEELTHDGVVPDDAILSTALSACGRTGNLSLGRDILSSIRESDVVGRLRTAVVTMYSSCGDMESARDVYDHVSADEDDRVASTAMVNGYAKIGQIDKARFFFDRMLEKDLVAWSSIIAGYAESDRPSEALELFNAMRVSGVRADRITMLSVISACANLGALDQATWVHTFIDSNGFSRDMSVCNALIDMYSKCGSLETARRLFDEMPRRNVITWTAMINGLAMHGQGMAAVGLFDRMKEENVQPNRVTFTGLLYACSHSGLVEQGQRVFKSMVLEYGLVPQQEQYGCMVDLFGRSKLFKLALGIIQSMPFRPNVVVWGSLLGACRLHGQVELGEFAAKRILELDPDHDGAYVLLSNIYAKAGRWGDVGEVRRSMKFQGVSKERGCSWIELDGKIHEFVMGDELHSQSKEIYNKLDEVVKELEVAGYDPNIGSVLVDLDEEEKRGAILLHSEKLALSFGLIRSTRGECIRISKNLRVCEDCHAFIKLVSKVFEREIIVRDRTRFHHYKNGFCSCGDFW